MTFLVSLDGESAKPIVAAGGLIVVTNARTILEFFGLAAEVDAVEDDASLAKA